jgi:hypothetical protein
MFYSVLKQLITLSKFVFKNSFMLKLYNFMRSHILGGTFCRVTIGGVWICGFIDHLYTRLGATSDYSATASISQMTTELAKLFPACCAFISRSLATASNSGYSSASRAQVLSSETPVQR